MRDAGAGVQAIWWWAGTALAVSALAGLLDWRDARRRDYDRPAMMPWTLIQVLALLGAVMLAGAALV